MQNTSEPLVTCDMQVDSPAQAQADQLEDRVQRALSGRDYEIRRMFGGKTFMLAGNMLCCGSPKGLMARIGAVAEPEALASPHAEPCLGAGRRMAGFIIVDFAGLTSDAEVGYWVGTALAYVGALPPKDKPAKPRKSRRMKP